MMMEVWGFEVRKRRASLAANCFAFCVVLDVCCDGVMSKVDGTFLDENKGA